jgi:hypothetical protein
LIFVYILVIRLLLSAAQDSPVIPITITRIQVTFFY